MVVENIPEPPVQGLVSQLHVAQAYGEGHILRLDMKGRCMGHSQLPGNFKPFYGQSKRHQEMNYIRPADGLLQGIAVRYSQMHPLGMDQPIEKGDFQLPYHIFPVLFLTGAHSSHLVAMLSQLLSKPLCRDSRSIVL